MLSNVRTMISEYCNAMSPKQEILQYVIKHSFSYSDFRRMSEKWMRVMLRLCVPQWNRIPANNAEQLQEMCSVSEKASTEVGDGNDHASPSSRASFIVCRSGADVVKNASALELRRAHLLFAALDAAAASAPGEALGLRADCEKVWSS